MVVRESILRDIMRVVVWYPLRWLITSLPVGLGFTVLRLMGDMHYLLGKGTRRRLLNNLTYMSGAAGRPSDNVRGYLRNHYIDHLLIFIFPRLGRNEVDRFVEIKGLQYLDAALKSGKGVVLVHGHVGPVHLPLVSLARLGYRMKQIGLPSDDGLSWVGRNVAFRLRLKYESMMPAEVILADSFLRGAFKWLASNGVLMITGDGSGTERRLGKHAVLAFLGQKMSFPLGPAILAEKTGAAIMPMFIEPGETGSGKLYRVVIEEPFSHKDKDKPRAIDMTEQFVARLEYYILKNPGYMHFLDGFHPGGLISAGSEN